MFSRSRIALAAPSAVLAVLLVPASGFAAVHSAAAEAAESVTLVPHHVAWVRVVVLAIMWLFLAAVAIGSIVTRFTVSSAPVHAATHSAADHAHH